MKVLHTPARFHPFTGGVENHVRDLGKELVDLGVEVEVLCAREPKDIPSHDTVNGVEVERLPYRGKIGNTNVMPSFPKRLLKKEYDVLHTHLPTPWSASWSSLAATLKRVPLVVTYHNDIVGQNGLDDAVAGLYNATFLKTLLRSADRIVITQPSYLEYSDHLEPYAEKVEVIPNGVDTDRFHPPEDAETGEGVFFLGVLDRYHRYKGLDILLEAFELVLEEVDTKLVVGGSGELVEEYEELAEELGISDDVEFVGFIPEEELPRYYRNCEAFALPSLSSEQEGFGMVLLEAMASGKPVVTTGVAGVSSDVEERGAGVVVEKGDPEELAEGILRLLNDDEAAEEMGREGRELVEERYTWRAAAEQTLDTYQAVLGGD